MWAWTAYIMQDTEALQKKRNIGQKDTLCFQKAECEIKYEMKKQQSEMKNEWLDSSR